MCIRDREKPSSIIFPLPLFPPLFNPGNIELLTGSVGNHYSTLLHWTVAPSFWKWEIAVRNIWRPPWVPLALLWSFIGISLPCGAISPPPRARPALWQQLDIVWYATLFSCVQNQQLQDPANATCDGMTNATFLTCLRTYIMHQTNVN